MIIISLFRIINDLGFVTLPQWGVIPQGDCIASFSQNPQRTILFNGLGNLLNHLLPIIWVLKIYNISSYEQSLSKADEESDKLQLIESFLKGDQ